MIMNKDLNSPYELEELQGMGFIQIGENVKVDRTCVFYGTPNIALESNIRVDAYCVFSAGEAGIKIGSFVHIATGVSILGSGGVTIEDFVGLSARVSVFSSNDDYTGGSMTNPTVPERYRNVRSAQVIFRRHAVVGCGSVILPGVELGVGASIGALTLVNKSIPPFTVVSGNPMRKIGMRGRRLLEYESQLRTALGTKTNNT